MLLSRHIDDLLCEGIAAVCGTLLELGMEIHRTLLFVREMIVDDIAFDLETFVFARQVSSAPTRAGSTTNASIALMSSTGSLLM
jgi:hypothetical protein